MKTHCINLYEFNELSDKAKQKAIDKWYEAGDYYFLTEDLTESCKFLLESNKVEYSDIKILYSLSSSQGDGLCFTGTIEKNGNKLKLTHRSRYYYAKSVNMTFSYSEGSEVNEAAELERIYLDVCKELEKEGYATMDYRMTFDEFAQHCDANQYFFEENGVMNNG